MLGSVLIALSLAQSAQAATSDRRPIVITGTPIAVTRRNLADCLRRRCPPVEDINASIAHAENLFVAGDYEDARGVLFDSISRNKAYGRQFPVEVADLYRSTARVSAHLGEGDRYRSASFAMRRTLKTGLPDSDPRVVASLFDLAQMHASLGDAAESWASYSAAMKQAKAIGRRDIAAAARMRRAWLGHQMGDTRFARRELQALAADPDPVVRTSRIGALVLLGQIDRQAGKAGNTEAVIAELRAAKLARPVLLFAPPMELPTRRALPGARFGQMTDSVEIGTPLRLLPTDNFEDRWVDVGFWVEPSGRVSDVEVLREGSDSSWSAPVLKSIRGRIYAPLADPAGSYRVERYTYTSLWQFVTGTRLRQRKPNGRIEFLDLTAEPSDQASASPR
jgi:hypothetical protein